MYSAFYRHFDLYPLMNNHALPTKTVENIIKTFPIFIAKHKGHFSNSDDVSTAIDIQLMHVVSHDSWSSEDYDSEETNYITAIVSRGAEEPVIECLYEVAQRLRWILLEENDEDGVILYSPK